METELSCTIFRLRAMELSSNCAQLLSQTSVLREWYYCSTPSNCHKHSRQWETDECFELSKITFDKLVQKFTL